MNEPALQPLSIRQYFHDDYSKFELSTHVKEGLSYRTDVFTSNSYISKFVGWKQFWIWNLSLK